MVAVLCFILVMVVIASLMALLESMLAHVMDAHLAHLVSNWVGGIAILMAAIAALYVIRYEAKTTNEESRHNDFEDVTKGLAAKQHVAYTRNPYVPHTNHP